jgi:predicted dehydrogenase
MLSKKQLRRRAFLGSAAAAAAAPWLIPHSVLAAGDRPGANDRITLGIIGMGVRGNQHLNNIPPAGQVAAICDCDLPNTATALKAHQAKWQVYQDYRKLIERKDIDAVIVCPTDPHHVLASMLACQAGKDVYCEKPLSVYVTEGRALVKAARKYRRVVQTGTQQRTMQMDRFACELVRDGGIGKIKAVECVNFRGPDPYPGFPARPIPAGLDWDLWMGPTPQRPYNNKIHKEWWGQWRDYAGNMMTFLGAHAFDMVQYALGTDQTGPVAFWPVEEVKNGRLHFRYADGVEVRMTFADDKPPYRGPRNGAVFVGEKCKIEINRNKFTTNPKDFVKNPPPPEAAAGWNGPGWIARGHVQNWLDCIKTRGTPNADVEIGHRTATICHLCNITRQLGRRLHWDPERETFVGDDEANRLLDRPRRKGWELPDVS